MTDQTANLLVSVDSRQVKAAEKNLDSFSKEAKKTEKATDLLTSSTMRANRGFKLQKGAIQQAGFQIQDFAVQVAGGTSALVAFGQQGSQLAGVLGPSGALLGAVIAIGSAIGGVLVNSMNEAETEIKEVDTSVKALIASIDKLTIRQAEFAIAGLEEQKEALIKVGGEANTATFRIETLKKNLSEFPSSEKAEDWRKELERLSVNSDTFSQATEELTKKQKALQDRIEEIRTGRRDQGLGVFGPSIEEFDREQQRRLGEQEKAAAEAIKNEKKASDEITRQAKRTAAVVAREQKKFADDFERLRDKIDPVGADLRQFGKDVALIQRAFSEGIITQSQADKMVNALNDVSEEFENSFTDAADRVSDSIADAIVSGDWGSVGDAVGGVIAASISQSISDKITANLADSVTADSGAIAQLGAAFAGPIAGAVVGAGVQVAINEALKFFDGGFDDDTTAADRQAAQGTGTVLGDISAKSSSIADSVDITSEATSELVGINRDMLTALKNLQQGIQGGVTRIARGAGAVDFELPGFDENFFASFGDEIGVAATAFFDIFTLGFGEELGKIFGGKSKVVDDGIRILGGSISDLVDEIVVESFQTTKVKKSVFSSTKTVEQFSRLEGDVERQFSLIFSSVVDSVGAGAEALGLSTADIQSKLDQFVIDTQQISLRGLNPEARIQALEEVFGVVFDDLAGFIVEGLEEFQIAGEGLGETLARVATNVQVTQEVIGRLGLSFESLSGSALIEASTRLVELSGGVGELASSVSGFISNFATDAQKLEIVQSDLTRALEQQNLVLPETRDGYFDLLQAQNASDEAGAENIATLLRLQGVADEYYGFLEDATEDVTEAAQELINVTEAFGSFFQAFATEEEKFNKAQSDLTGALSALGLTVPETARGFWDLVHAQDVSTESGAEAINALLATQDTAIAYYAFLEKASDAAADAAKLASEAARDALELAHRTAMSVSDAALDAIKRSVDARKDEITDAYNIERDQIKLKHADELEAIKESAAAQRDSITATKDAQLAVNRASIDAARDSLSNIRSEVSGITSALSSLTSESEPIREMRRQSALSQLRTGNLAGSGDAARIAAGISAADFATAADFEREQGTTRILLEELEASGLQTVSAAERTVTNLESQTDAINDNAKRSLEQSKALEELALEEAKIRHEEELLELETQHEESIAALDAIVENAELQLNTLRGIDTSLLSIDAALKQGGEALAAETEAQAALPAFAHGGQHSGGVRLVGERGPELEFTGPSRIMSNSQTAGLLSNAELVQELRELREELRISQLAIAKNTLKSSKQLERWDVDGIPEERT